MNLYVVLGNGDLGRVVEWVDTQRARNTWVAVALMEETSQIRELERWTAIIEAPSFPDAREANRRRVAEEKAALDEFNRRRDGLRELGLPHGIALNLAKANIGPVEVQSLEPTDVRKIYGLGAKAWQKIEAVQAWRTSTEA